MGSNQVPDAIHQKLVLNTALTEVSRAEQAVLEAAEQCGYDGSERFAVKLAIEEALANAIKHGNACDPAKRVILEFSITGDELRISVCDEGPGFNPCCIPDPTLDENLEKPSGRGVMLMRTYMNEVFFNQSGNCVTMIKRRARKPEKKANGSR